MINKTLLVIVIFLFVSCVDIKIRAEGFDEEVMGEIIKFSGGVVTSYLIHEGGHFLAGKVTNTSMDFNIGGNNQFMSFTEHSESRSKGLLISVSGLLIHPVSSEIILQTKGINKNDNFVRGMMFWNVCNPIMYSLDYWVIHRTNSMGGKNSNYAGDISGIEYYSDRGSANGFAIGISALALFQGYRFLKTQDWAPDWLKTENKINLAPLPSGGFIIGYKIDF